MNQKQTLRQIAIYLLVGAWNTLFGAGLFAILHATLSDRIHWFILLAASNEAAIINAYIGYRICVFRSTLPIFRELVRFHGIYALSSILGMITTAVLVKIFSMHPTIASFCALALTITLSFIVHRAYTFKQPLTKS